MSTRFKTLDVNYGLVIKQTVTTQELVWAIYYLIEMKGIAPKKISKTMLNRFLKDQMSMFGRDGDSLFGSSYEEDSINDDLY